MSSQFRTINRDSLYLFFSSIQNWLPDDHLARFIVEIVKQLDLGKIEQGYGERGKAPYYSGLKEEDFAQ